MVFERGGCIGRHRSDERVGLGLRQIGELFEQGGGHLFALLFFPRPQPVDLIDQPLPRIVHQNPCAARAWRRGVGRGSWLSADPCAVAARQGAAASHSRRCPRSGRRRRPAHGTSRARSVRHALRPGRYSGRLLERSVAEELEAVEPHRALLAAMGCAVLVYAEPSKGVTLARAEPSDNQPQA